VLYTIHILFHYSMSNRSFRGYCTTTSASTGCDYSLEINCNLNHPSRSSMCEFLTLPRTSQILRNNYMLSRLRLLYSIRGKVYILIHTHRFSLYRYSLQWLQAASISLVAYPVNANGVISGAQENDGRESTIFQTTFMQKAA